MKADFIFWEQKNEYQNSCVVYFLYFSAVAYLVNTFQLQTTIRNDEGGNKLPCMNAQCGALHPKVFRKELRKYSTKETVGIVHKIIILPRTPDITYLSYTLLTLEEMYRIVRCSNTLYRTIFWKKKEAFSTIHILIAVQMHCLIIHTQYVDL